jgi:threonine/homoserine/homoserine lactone efflux protein
MTAAPEASTTETVGRPVDYEGSKTAAINALAGLLVVVGALVAVVVINVITLASVDEEASKVSIATASVGVIGTIVGAFFGIKIASDTRKSSEEGRQRAEEQREAEKIKVEELAAAAAQPQDALRRADERIQNLRTP